MSDQLPAFVRTLIPLLVGPLLARYGLDITDPTLLAIVTAVIGYGYYVLVHVVEMHVPKAGWLLGIAKAPAYSTEPAPSPDSGEDVAAVVVPDEGHTAVDSLLFVVSCAVFLWAVFSFA